MGLVEQPCSVSSKVLNTSSTEPSSNESLAYEYGSEISTVYTIECKQQAAWALVLFTQPELTDEHATQPLAIKVLREYQDPRYSLETLEKRQRYQLETLKRNRILTPEIYLGVARVDALDICAHTIHLGEIIPDPSFPLPDPHAEYALIMRQLPDKRRLDVLLDKEDDSVLRAHICFMAAHIAYSHQWLISTLLPEEEAYWGSCKQLGKKLQQNLALLDQILPQQAARQPESYHQLEWRLNSLKERLWALFTHYCERGYFEQRVGEHAIKHCHGDLKALHIWIERQDNGSKVVSMLDSADFNPSYTHIDVLSDVAMLAIDIQTRTQSPSLADLLLEEYLTCAKQQDGVTRAVLAYYLVEKAIVGAAISLLYDGLPDLGWAFLKIAETRLHAAEQLNSSRYQ